MTAAPMTIQPMVRPARGVRPEAWATYGRPAQPPRGAMRLTARGRLLVTAVVTLVAVAVMVLGASWMTSAGATSVEREVTVQSGQTLSHVAAQEMPELPRGEAVTQIQQANNLSSMHVSAGQVLVIPRG